MASLKAGKLLFGLLNAKLARLSLGIIRALQISEKFP
jgi:hypothetical protein